MKSIANLKRAGWISLLSACTPLVTSPPPVAVPPSLHVSASLPAEHCLEDLTCWKRRTLTLVLENESLIRENSVREKETTNARAGEAYAEKVAEKLRKDAEPSVLSSPLLWLGIGVLGGIVLSLGAGLVWSQAAKAR